MAFDLSKLSSAFSAKPAKQSVVGIDIGSSAIKVVQIHNNKGVPTLETYGELQLGPYESVDIGRTTNLNAAKTIEALIDIMRESTATATNIALATSYNASFSTIIPISKTDQDKIDTILPVEAKKYVPVALSEVTLGWLPAAPPRDRKMSNILLLASHKESLKKYETVVSGANLNAVLQEIEILSTIRSTVATNQKTTAIIDFGARSTRLYIVENGLLSRTHSVLLSGVSLTSALTKATNQNFRAAEELKRRVGLAGLSDNPLIQKTIVAELERGLRELHKAMTRYDEESSEKISSVILSGSGALLYGLRGYLEEMFMRPIVMADPFAKVAYPAFLEDTLKEAGPSFAVAIGAALGAVSDAK